MKEIVTIIFALLFLALDLSLIVSVKRLIKAGSKIQGAAAAVCYGIFGVVAGFWGGIGMGAAPPNVWGGVAFIRIPSENPAYTLPKQTSVPVHNRSVPAAQHVSERTHIQTWQFAGSGACPTAAFPAGCTVPSDLAKTHL